MIILILVDIEALYKSLNILYYWECLPSNGCSNMSQTIIIVAAA